MKTGVGGGVGVASEDGRVVEDGWGYPVTTGGQLVKTGVGRGGGGGGVASEDGRVVSEDGRGGS